METTPPVFIQTSDPTHYLPMLLASSRTVRAYCAKWGFGYEAYIGVKRGCWPWQATFNRLYMLHELIERGGYGWVVYMDADAYIADLSFDLQAYLAPMADKMAVLCPSNHTDQWWDVNAGVALLNLRHPGAVNLVEQWRADFERHHTDEALRAAETWGNPDDQEMLQHLLQSDEGLRAQIHFESHELMNSVWARFIRQLKRGEAPDAESRLQAIRREADLVVGSEAVGAEAPATLKSSLQLAGRRFSAKTREADIRAADRDRAEDLITRLYAAMLNRPVDPAGMWHFKRLVGQVGLVQTAEQIVAGLLTSEEHRIKFKDP